MRIETQARNAADVEADARVEILFEGESIAEGPLAADDARLDGLLSEITGAEEAKGKAFEQTLVHTVGRLSTRRLLLLGAGKRQDYSVEKVTRLAGQAARIANKSGWKTLVLGSTFLSGGLPAGEVAEAAVVGADLALLPLDTFRTKEPTEVKLEALILAEPSGAEGLEPAAQRGRVVGDSVNLARGLVNEPGNELYPEVFAERAQKLGEELGLQVEVLTADQLREKGMGLLMAVGQGSEHEPRLVTLRYGSFEGKPVLGLVGKGVTFDSGGISIKSAQNMEDMKTDMSGAAAVLGALHAIAQTRPEINVLGVMPLAENLPSGRATRPGDVIRGRNGKTVEVLNTDAEGRMILADALAYAQELGATHIVDLATLTGACVVALGAVATGAMGEPQEWVDRVMACSRAVGEKIWQLPLYEEYRELIKSPIADMENSGGRWAGAITGAWFLKEFINEGTAWVHLDIAGTATLDKDTAYLPKGPSGVGVRALVRLAHEMAQG